MLVTDFLDPIDRYQRGHPWLGFPLAVTYKFIENRGPQLAALITYFGFLSLFPLLLVTGTALRVLVHDDPGLQRRLLGSALARFPVVGDELTSGVHPLEGTGLTIVVGVLVAMYGGLGFTVAVQNAFDQVWSIPVDRRPHPLVARVRGLVLLVVLGAGVVTTTALATLSTAPDSYGVPLGVGARVLATVASVLVNSALFVIAFRHMTVREPTYRQVLPGAVAAAVSWQLLQSAGVRYVSTELDGSDGLYGLFGLVLSLLAWIYLEALVVVFAAEVNTVAVDRLWPRALLAIAKLKGPAALTDADHRSYRSYAGAQRYQRFERISVEFTDTDVTDTDGEGRP